MATWRTENSMLTMRGVEILNKVKAGIGSITVTRIVAGSGRVSESALFVQTGVSGNTKPMVLTNKDIRDSGSEISIYIENSKFTESFELHQIGVYVTHVDYEGEQLYHISQCDSVGADLIPALGETVTTFGYSLFLEHGNSSSINITVDPQGVVQVKDFEKYKVSVESRITNLKYSDVGAVPLGYAEEHLKDIMTETDLDTKIEAVYASMRDYSSKKVLVTLNAGHPVIGGGDRILRIDRMTDLYGVIHTISYDPKGVALEYFRSKISGVWTSWARNYNTFYKPTHLDVGAAPYSLIYGEASAVSKENLNSTLLEWFNSMDARQTHHFILNSSGGGSILEGGNWFITIDKVGAIYGMVTAKKYLSSTDVPGIMIKTCSIYEGQVTNWGVINSGAVIPASLE